MPLLTAVVSRPHLRVPITRTFQETVLPFHPLAWWKADETAGATTMIDYSGNGNDAAYNLSASLTQHAAPLRAGSSGCCQMTGNSYAANISSSGLAIGTTSGSTYTIACIVNKTGGGAVLQKAFGYGIANLADENGPFIGYRASVGAAAYGHAQTGQTFRLFSPNASAGTTIFLAYTKNGTTWKLYENGTEVASDTRAFGAPSYTTVEMLGTSSFASSDGFIGYGSDFMIFSAALTTTELLPMAQAAGLA